MKTEKRLVKLNDLVEPVFGIPRFIHKHQNSGVFVTMKSLIDRIGLQDARDLVFMRNDLSQEVYDYINFRRTMSLIRRKRKLS